MIIGLALMLLIGLAVKVASAMELIDTITGP